MKTIKCCETCLYMATHEMCNDCLTLPGDYKDFNKEGNWKRPEFRYLNYQEGNWMDRIIQWEIEGKTNIVIGGQGEAEVNTKWTPQETSDHLHYVSEQCGYVTGRLNYNKDEKKIGLKIYTTESHFRLVWDAETEKLLYIEDIINPNGWSWKNENPFRKAS